MVVVSHPTGYCLGIVKGVQTLWGRREFLLNDLESGILLLMGLIEFEEFCGIHYQQEYP